MQIQRERQRASKEEKKQRLTKTMMLSEIKIQEPHKDRNVHVLQDRYKCSFSLL